MRLSSVSRLSVLLLVVLGGRLAAGAESDLLKTVPHPQPPAAESFDKAAEARWLEAEVARRLPAMQEAGAVPGPLVARGLLKPSELVAEGAALYANVGIHGSKARRIVRITRDGKVRVLAEGRRAASALTAGSDGQVYWVEEGTVLAVSRKGGPPRALVGFAHAEPTSLVEHGGTLYATLRSKESLGSGGALVAIDKKGQVRMMARAQPMPAHLTVDGRRLFWTSRRVLHSLSLNGGYVLEHETELRGPLIPSYQNVFSPAVGGRDLLWVSRSSDVSGIALPRVNVDSLVKRGTDFYFTSTSPRGVVRNFTETLWVEGDEPPVVSRFKGERGLLALMGGQLYVLAVDGPAELGWLYRVDKLLAP